MWNTVRLRRVNMREISVNIHPSSRSFGRRPLFTCNRTRVDTILRYVERQHVREEPETHS